MARDLKPLPDHDPARSKLAAAIALEAGARRDLQAAAEAAGLAAERCWDAQSKLDELRKVVAAPSGALADSFIASVGAGNPCTTATLERSSVAAGAKLAATENEFAVWDETRRECELATRAKEAALVAAQERLQKAARMVVCNSENVAKLTDDLVRLQAEIVEKRSALRFISRHGCNGELAPALSEQIERVLWQDLMGLETTDSYRAWDASFNELLTNSEAELPGD